MEKIDLVRRLILGGGFVRDTVWILNCYHAFYFETVSRSTGGE
ncbi:hypothetical protein ACMU9U_001605 [Yersinia enterocolitica]|nr:hypothetical protein [Yersinia enterocolitica]